MEKQLIINAEDFGLDEEINRGIIQSYQNGIVTSASLVANGMAFYDAVKLARENSALGVGVHLCLVAEKAILPEDKIPSLVNGKGFFFKDYAEFILKFYFKGISLFEIEKELEAQITKIIEAGVQPTHLDSHQHIHMIPPIFNIVIKLAKKYDIKVVRLVREKLNYNFFSKVNFFIRVFLLFLFYQNKIKLDANGILYSDRFWGFSYSGDLNQEILINWLRNLDFGLTEIICHPGFYPKAHEYYHWNYKWAKELSILTNPQLMSLISASGIELVNWTSVK